jgi:Thioredoxin
LLLKNNNAIFNFLMMITIETQNTIVKESIAKGMSYTAYKKIIKALVLNKQTTGADPSEERINYTKLNSKRMDRLDKTITISAEDAKKIKAIKKNLIWLIITESWCGDASQTLPIINKVASVHGHTELKIVLRDENEALITQFLTHGAQAIPKLIMIERDTMKILCTWGPRPSKATAMVDEFKSANGKLTPEFKQELQLWYHKDKGKSTVADLIALLA